MEPKINVQELFLELKSKKPNRTKSFDRALCTLGVHQDAKTKNPIPAKKKKALRSVE